MKNISRIIMIAAIVAVFCACKRDTDAGEQGFGTPYVEITIEGTIIKEIREYHNPETDKIIYDTIPLQGIVLDFAPNGEYFIETNQVYSDNKGKYTILDRHITSRFDGTVAVRARDLDSDANGGRFVTETINIEVSRNDFDSGEGKWCEGILKKKLDILMKPVDRD